MWLLSGRYVEWIGFIRAMLAATNSAACLNNVASTAPVYSSEVVYSEMIASDVQDTDSQCIKVCRPSSQT